MKNLLIHIKEEWYKYLLEIIVIALSIFAGLELENWNENRKEVIIENNIYKQLLADINNDLADIERVIKAYQDDKYLYEEILNGSIAPELLDSGMQRLIWTYYPMEVETNGVDQLLTIGSRDSLAIRVNNTYTFIKNNFSLMSQTLQDNTLKNLLYVQNSKPWFAQFVAGNITQEAKQYFLQSQDYKNRAAGNYILIYQNYIPLLEYCNYLLKDLRQGVEARLE